MAIQEKRTGDEKMNAEEGKFKHFVFLPTPFIPFVFLPTQSIINFNMYRTFNFKSILLTC